MTDDASKIVGLLGEITAHATNLTHHAHELQQIGLPDHWPAELVVERLRVLEAAVWAVARAALDAHLEVVCKARQLQEPSNVVKLQRKAA